MERQGRYWYSSVLPKSWLILAILCRMYQISLSLFFDTHPDLLQFESV